MEKAGVLDLEL